MTEYVENRRHVIERNPNYRGEPYPCEGEPGDKEKGFSPTAARRMPFVDTSACSTSRRKACRCRRSSCRATTTRRRSSAPTTARDDRVDAATTTKKDEGIPARRGFKLPTTIDVNNWYLGFNLLDPVVGKGDTPEQAERNRKLRQALSIAIDWEEHIAIFEHGQGVAAQGPLPPALFGYREDGPAAFNPVATSGVGRQAGAPLDRRGEEAARRGRLSRRPRRQDRQAAGAQLRLPARAHARAQGAARLDTKQFAKIGIQLEVRATDYNQFQDKMRKGTHQIFFWGWLADYPDAENFLFLLYGPNAKALTDGRREHRELPEPGVRQAVRAAEVPRRRPARSRADRRDGRRSCSRTRRGASATSRRRRRPTSSGSTTASRRRSDPRPRSATCGSTRSCARASMPSGTSRSGGRSPLLALALLVLAIVPAWFAWRAARARRPRRATLRGRAAAAPCSTTSSAASATAC